MKKSIGELLVVKKCKNNMRGPYIKLIIKDAKSYTAKHP